jgi:hypothetical protein
MSKTANTPETNLSVERQQRLEQLLQAYGRNPLRWPEADRQHFAGLVRAPHLLPAAAAGSADELDRLLDLAGPAHVGEPSGARARLLQRVSGEPQLADDITAPPPLGGLRGWLAAGMLAASLVLGAFIGLDTSAGNTLAASFQAGSSADEVLDIVFADPDELDDGGVL